MASASVFQISFSSTIYTRKFVGGKAEKVAEVQFKGDTLEDVLDGVWLETKDYMQRKVIFVGETPSWDEKESPTKEELKDFVTMKVPKNKQKITIPELTIKLLQSFSDKEVAIHVHIYGDGVGSKAKFELLENQLLKPLSADRAGSESTMSAVEMIETLKRIHSHRYNALYASWLKWATFIHRQDKSKHDSLIYGSPPQHLVDLFDHAPRNSTTQLRSAQNQMGVAKNINNAHSSDLEEVQKLYDVALEQFNQLSVTLKDLGQRLNEMKGSNDSRESLLSEMEQVLSPYETIYSSEVEMEVADCIDVDHNDM